MITAIRDVRRAKGLTLEQVANRCDPPTTAQTIGRLETQLPPEFVRAHRSYIVNIRHITKIEGNTVWLGKHSVPVGESYRDALLARLPMLR